MSPPSDGPAPRDPRQPPHPQLHITDTDLIVPPLRQYSSQTGDRSPVSTSPAGLGPGALLVGGVGGAGVGGMAVGGGSGVLTASGGDDTVHRSGSSSGLPGTSKQTRTCFKCQGPLTSQFVRALGGTFHLDCFECKVTSPRQPNAASLVLTLVCIGLRRDSGFQVLPRRRRVGPGTVPAVREGLLPATRSSMPRLRRGPARLVHHGARPEIPH